LSLSGIARKKLTANSRKLISEALFLPQRAADVVLGLNIEPEAGRLPEIRAKSDGRGCGNGTASVYDLVDGVRGNAEGTA